MLSQNFFRGLCALFIVLLGASFTTASPIAVNADLAVRTLAEDTSVAARASGGGWCWPFCNPFSRGVPNAPSRYNFRPPASTARPQYFDTPDNQVTLRAETQASGAVLVTVSVGTRYTLPAGAEINVRLLVRGTNIDFNHADLSVGSETAVVRITPEQAAGFRTGERSEDGSFAITLLYKLGQEL
ncbi:hypothetical protein CSAL01_08973 [Colletotrichum salicis]|uniref:CS1 type fimbrial major subunit n=1 Tax=Colletotrichum salicis TaxID=1209931 RepID=A0A135V4U5_9PEZI|nr:hypothetical protein CSAL01_08973 [Colletotrichum salicis]